MTLVFLGSGDFGKELFNFNKQFKIEEKILLLSIKNFKSKKFLNFKNSKKKIKYFITIGNPNLRSLIYNKITKNKKLINTKIIFKNVTIGKKTKIDAGTVVMSNVVISSNVSIGKNCHIHPNVVIGHDVKIGKNVTISANVFIGGNSKIDDNCVINPNSTIIKNIKISKNCSVGSGSVVIYNLKHNTHVFGVPAKIL
jgi:sugar O-acyltransferase (sialic acid O-acetyltransferase NeuD family)